jgi:hypothetical protein
MRVQKNAEDKHEHAFRSKQKKRRAIHATSAAQLIVCFHKLDKIMANLISHKANANSLPGFLSTVFQHIVPRGTLD